MINGKQFRIVPFTIHYGKTYGYHVLYNVTNDGFMYLYDQMLSWGNGTITAGEYTIQHTEHTTKHDMIRQCMHSKKFKPLGLEGAYIVRESACGLGLAILQSETKIEARVRKGNELNFYTALKEVEIIKEEPMPNDFDLFSFLEGGIAI